VNLNIVNEVATLERLSIGQLRQRFAELFGEATAASNRTWLIKRIAWRLQALAEGDLSERARRRAAELARDADLRLNPPRSQTTTAPPPEPISLSAPVDPRLPFPDTLLTCPDKGARWTSGARDEGENAGRSRLGDCRTGEPILDKVGANHPAESSSPAWGSLTVRVTPR
jgi:hypothetical protein